MSWDKLLAPGKKINRTIVNEFYVHVYDALEDEDKPESVQVRGVEVKFRPDAIRLWLEMDSDGEDTTCHIDDDLGILQGVVSYPGTSLAWSKRGGNRKEGGEDRPSQ